MGVPVREVPSVIPCYDPPMEGGVMTLNCNGWSTPVKQGKKMVKRKTLILNMAKTHKVGILGVQETHFKSQAEVKAEQFWLAKHGFMMEATVQENATSKGTAAIIWDKQWAHVSTHVISSRILVVCLQGSQKKKMMVVCGHMHHEAPQRSAQWTGMVQQLQAIPRDSAIYCMDHNSVIVPGSDSQVIPEAELPSITAARRLEVDTIRKHNMIDAWNVVHAEREVEVPGYTYSFAGANPNPRRLDRVHVSDGIAKFCRGAYNVLTASSDHKAVVIQLGPQEEVNIRPRFRVPPEMLEDEEALEDLKKGIGALGGDGPVTWWDRARELIRRKTEYWKRANFGGYETDLGRIIRSCTPTTVPRDGWEYLAQQGLQPGSTREAYALLVSLSGAERATRFKATMCEILRPELQQREERHENNRLRKKRVVKLVSEMRERQNMARVRDQGGRLTRDPMQMAEVFKNYWGGVMSPTGRTESECSRYIESLPILERVRQAFPLLFKPLSIDIVQCALKKMPKGSSPGRDGVPIELYQALPDLFVPQLHRALSHFLETGTVPESWSTALMKNTPKFAGAEKPQDMRPLMLQNTCYKWLSAVILSQSIDAIQQITPPQQKGFLPGRQMVDHITHVRMEWENSPDIILVSVDFSKAYDSVLHVFVAAALRYLGAPPLYIALLMAMLAAHVNFVIGKGYVQEVCLSPQSGIRQGDPLSPAIFSMLTTFLIYDLQRLKIAMFMMLYADDIILGFKARGGIAKKDAAAAIYVLSIFGYFSGLRMNAQKTFVLYKSTLDPAPETVAGLTVVQKLKYLGIWLGHISAGQAYGPSLQAMYHRASYLRNLPLSLEEKAELLMIWIAPVVYLTAIAYAPNLQVESQLQIIQNLALSMNSWTLTKHMLAERGAAGGVELAPLSTYANWVHAKTFIRATTSPHMIPKYYMKQFQDWKRSKGIVVSEEFLPYFQLAPIPLGLPTFLQGSCRA